ncbi:MAG: heterodisulfide reductase-related iron-sulfur binding cluster [Anaerolineales bacterium]|nr:heterodisulfide reductase-related iron-sulfur binding cluster [Anaerolineales bacterium]
MKHTIKLEDYGPLASEMSEAVSKCVHCGFCLPACPTYKVLQQEMDSPRGRIIIMKSVLENQIPLEEAMPYIDHCLGCLGCETVCPSGVQYGNLLSPFRALAESKRKRPIDEQLSRWVTKETLPYPNRFYYAAKLGKISKPLSSAVPKRFQAMLNLIPESIPALQSMPEVFPAQGVKRGKVALQVGCVQQVLAQEINLATINVLTRNGYEVVIPKNQGCCGALALHTGDHQTARDLAANNLRSFPNDSNAIISNAAGCGSSMHEYPLLFKNTELEEAAVSFSRRVRDISVFLSEIDLAPIPAAREDILIAYHDACHLAHAQGITQEPRSLLTQIPNLSLVPINEGDLCCGSAGSYNLEQPDIAEQLGERKATNILNTKADAVATGNIGCLVQLRNHLSKFNGHIEGKQSVMPVMHTIEIIDLAYQEKL